MRIRITAELPVPAEVRPHVGEEYEVFDTQRAPCDELLHFIRVGIAQIGVLSHECVPVDV